MIGLYSYDYQKIGVPGPDSAFFLKSVDYKLVGPSGSQNFIVKSLKIEKGGMTKLTLQIKSKKGEDRVGQHKKYRLLTVRENQLSRMFSSKEGAIKEINVGYYQDYDLYGFSGDDKIYIIINEKPFEILEIKNSIP